MRGAPYRCGPRSMRVRTSRGPITHRTMRTCNAFLILCVTACVTWIAHTQACDASQSQNGCKIYGTTCKCGYGCKTEFNYKTRRACLNALREMNSNFCSRAPCVRGICIQTVQAPGFTCKCEGTGYYGQRCEKACPTTAVYGLVFPHECIII